MVMAKLALLAVAVVVLMLDAVSLVSATNGTATFYTQYVPSACYGSTDKGTMIAAASDVFWNNGAACGQRYRVTCTGATNPVPHPCTGASVVVTIVDHCPAGCAGTIDLSRQAFAIIANPVAGKVQVDYTQV